MRILLGSKLLSPTILASFLLKSKDPFSLYFIKSKKIYTFFFILFESCASQAHILFYFSFTHIHLWLNFYLMSFLITLDFFPQFIWDIFVNQLVLQKGYNLSFLINQYFFLFIFLVFLF